MGGHTDVRTHTALHVLKGAVQKVLQVRWTAGVWVEGLNGRLTVLADRNPTQQELEDIEREANEKIREDQDIVEYTLDRNEAENRWGDSIYDMFPLPEGITTVTVVCIPGWNVNCCKENHTRTTGEIGRITLRKTRFRKNKNLLEISFSVEPGS
ncbi:MAG: alanyl-tRNA editing protein [Theionarchaea archaeon]|nr:alanyl-tRNA editing protein [Theionarchaea archaeon]MBU7019715.1 alanyl-tRNA editing protein [Theionarchaea archaeon]MBU7034426.1 alanyl-tRNA editing protein [Theionarchaea archaeon]MBU7040637.1 alanyl-tRNA editing protein [Theionarchaea archaeon]